MAQLVINVGASPNDGQGDPIRTSFQKVNTNFSELFSRVQTEPPATLKGSPGDLAGMIAYTPTYFYYCFADYTNGINNIWATIDQTGNVIAEAMEDGNSSITFETASGPITVTVDGVANVARFETTGTTLSNLIAQSVAATSVSTGSLSATGNISTTGSMSALSLDVQGPITATTSITGEFFYGNGAFLTGISGGGGGGSGDQISSGFTKVYIPTTSGNVVFDVGLNTGMAVFTPSALILDGSLSAATVSGTLSTPSQPNITQVGTLSSLSVTGDISGSNLTATGATVSGNVSAGNISTVGNVSATYFVGDGSLLTNITGAGIYGNTEVAEYLPTYTGNLNPGNVNATSVRANNLATNGTATLTVTGNTRFQNNVAVTGNITGNLNGNVSGTLTGTSVGTHNGLVYSIDIRDMSWDFGFINANAFTNPIQYLLAQTGNIDMGTFPAPSSLEIDTGTF